MERDPLLVSTSSHVFFDPQSITNSPTAETIPLPLPSRDSDQDSEYYDVSSSREMKQLVTVSFIFSFLLLTIFFAILAAWRHEVRWIELGLGATGWMASETAKPLIFSIFTRKTQSGEARLGLPTVLHAAVQELFRLGAIFITVRLLPIENRHFDLSNLMPQPPPHLPSPPRRPLPPLDVLFFSALAISLGWAAMEIFFNSINYWRWTGLYENDLDRFDEEQEEYSSRLEDEDEEEEIEEEVIPRNGVHHPHFNTILYPLDQDDSKASGMPMDMSPSAFDSAIEMERQEIEEVELERLNRDSERREVETQLGIPLYDVPVAVVCIWRLDSCLLSLVLTLLLSLPFRTTSPSLFAFPLWPTFFATVSIHALLSLLWVSRTRWVGIPAISYLTLVLLLGLSFAVGAAWGALN